MSAVVPRAFAVLLLSVVGTASASLLRTQKSSEPVEALTREDLLLSTPPQQSAKDQLLNPPAATILSTAESFTHQSLESQAAQMKIMKQQLKTQQDQIQRLKAKHAAEAPSSLKAPTRSLLDLSTKVVAASQAAAGSAGAGTTRPKGWDTCLKYARWVKTQDISGVEFVRLWKTTCEPAARSGRATDRYKLMCNSLTGVLKPYSNQIDYDVETLCSEVLTVFADVSAVQR